LTDEYVNPKAKIMATIRFVIEFIKVSLRPL
jgi:hypothetical protein